MAPSETCVFKMATRKNAVPALKKLQQDFQLILVSGTKIMRMLKILSWFSSKGIVLSAAYQVSNLKLSENEDASNGKIKYFCDYSKIVTDFGLKGRV